MSVDIYYFSGTGNSLVVARDLSEKLKGNLIPIASVIDKDVIIPESDIIGIIFPVYNIEHDCLPLIIGRFVNRLKNIDSKYIFAVCTFGGGSYKALDNLNKLIISRGGKLSAGFGVQMPQNAFHNKIFSNNEKIFNKWRNKRDGICDFILTKKTNNLNDVRNLLAKIIMTPIIRKEQLKAEKLMNNLSKISSQNFSELMQFSDNSYTTDDNCTGCGICSKVCPVNNIEIVNKKPKWLNHCETCLACFHWCPKKAIHGGMVSLSDNENYHYHHPDVTLKDMINKD